MACIKVITRLIITRIIIHVPYCNSIHVMCIVNWLRAMAQAVRRRHLNAEMHVQFLVRLCGGEKSATETGFSPEFFGSLHVSIIPPCYINMSVYFLFFPVILWANGGHGLLILAVSRSHTTTHHSR